jgi:hypothetical protein
MSKTVEKAKMDVERILKRDQRSRNSDKALILDYMFTKTNLANITQEMKNLITRAVYAQMPSFETITRARRKLQASGLYKGTMATKSLRKAQEKAMREMFR